MNARRLLDRILSHYKSFLELIVAIVAFLLYCLALPMVMNAVLRMAFPDEPRQPPYDNISNWVYYVIITFTTVGLGDMIQDYGECMLQGTLACG